MIGSSHTEKIEPSFLTATVISIGFHFFLAVLLIFFLKSTRLINLPRNIITVDLRTLETHTDEKAELIHTPVTIKSLKLKPAAPTQIQTASESARKSSIPLVPGPLPIQLKHVTADTRPETVPFHPGGVSPVNNLSNPERPVEIPKKGNASSPEKGTLLRRAEESAINTEKAYLAALREMIEEHKEYPLMARKSHMEGTVHVICKMSRHGEIMDTTIVRTSGYNILDNAAKRAVALTGRFPEVPPQIKGDSFSFVSPISFRLTDE